MTRRLARWRLVVGMAVAVLFQVGALQAEPHAHPGPMSAPCIDEAASFHRVNAMVLRAIIAHESGGDPTLVLRNKNGSVDVGLGGVNSVHFAELARYGVQPGDLLDGCVNVYVAAWHLARRIQAFGNNWSAVGSYHSRTPKHRDRYARETQAILQTWGAIPPRAAEAHP